MGGTRLTELFLAGLEEDRRAGVERSADLERLLAESLASGVSAWPGVRSPPDTFLGHLAARLPANLPVETALQRLHSADLYLACACSLGDARAIATFEARFLPDVEVALRQLRLPDALLEDVKQILRDRLFVAQGKRRAKIGEYAGRGDLKSWARTIAVRAALRLMRRAKRTVPLSDEALAVLVSPGQDPELAHLKKTYTAEFKTALGEALGSLSTRERNLLRHHVLDKLGIDRIASLYRLHRATAARQLARIRQTVIDRTRDSLLRRLKVDGVELESVMRLVASQLDVSLARLLRTVPDKLASDRETGKR